MSARFDHRINEMRQTPANVTPIYLIHVKIKFHLLKQTLLKKGVLKEFLHLFQIVNSSSDRKTFPEFYRNEPIDFFIDKLTEGQKAGLIEKQSNLSPFSVLSELLNRGSYLLLIRYSGNPCYWPEFIQSFKEAVSLKHSFKGSIRMGRLTSVFDGS